MSGDATPSPEDLALTERLMNAGELMRIPVLDHFVVASAAEEASAWTSIGSSSEHRSADVFAS